MCEVTKLIGLIVFPVPICVTMHCVYPWQQLNIYVVILQYDSAHKHSLALYDSSMLLLSCTYAITANDACRYLLVPPLAHYCFFGAFYLNTTRCTTA